MEQIDVIVIGGGHAGCEAAMASARLGAKTVLVTMRQSELGILSCNPAIGGLGKGHLVREIDAMDGIMGVAADAAAIQYRLLNRSKGPAVQGPRVQADRKLYREAIQQRIASQPKLQVVEAEVVDLGTIGEQVTEAILADERRLSARAVVLTAGTFLRGVLHIGHVRSSGGRLGSQASIRLAERLDDMGVRRIRLKTGTPPRLDGTTIDWASLTMQSGDTDPVMMSFASHGATNQQISCGVTETNEETHQIVRDNLDRSAMYGGQIEGIGPRYCPSIEDKITRFADKMSHQVYLEPEGLDDTTVYPNGISTSLPADVQERYVRSIHGLESARIVQPGYAIEYDCFDPRGLSPALAVKTLRGLYFAGQINGTTGYEEAAAQGLVAGLNAAHHALGRPEVLFSRTQSYIGVMVDDLVTRGVTEPYRMFTSRAEYRLSLRADNADQRLTPVAVGLGCISQSRRVAFESKLAALTGLTEKLRGTWLSTSEAQRAGIIISQNGEKRSLYDLLSFPDVNWHCLVKFCPELADVQIDAASQVSIDALYAPYVIRQTTELEGLRRSEAQILPEDFDFASISGLSRELQDKLIDRRPHTVAHAMKIEGMTPAAITVILAKLRKMQTSRKVT